MSHPHGWAMGCPVRGFWRGVTALYWHCTVHVLRVHQSGCLTRLIETLYTEATECINPPCHFNVLVEDCSISIVYLVVSKTSLVLPWQPPADNIVCFCLVKEHYMYICLKIKLLLLLMHWRYWRLMPPLHSNHALRDVSTISKKYRGS